MSHIGNPAVQARLKEEFENIEACADAVFGVEISKHQAMTPIELLAFIQLLSLSIQEAMFGRVFDVTPQVEIGTYRADFVVSTMGESFIVECDGHDFHEKTKEQAARDKKRDRYLQGRGYKVFRFTGSEIWRNRDWFDDVLAELDAIRVRAYEKHGNSR